MNSISEAIGQPHAVVCYSKVEEREARFLSQAQQGCKGGILVNSHSSLELWGGVECTINRVGDTYYDQHARSGHRERVSQDMELFASLGLRTLRTAVHWEHFEKTQSWTFADRMLASMECCGLRPIVGLLHHGSGPSFTSLLDPAFPEKLAAFALQTARRYPWILDYTPVNEPQSTARFACLYGHWFPHHRNMRSYVRAMYHQVKAIILAMRNIRSIQPEARLIHTEDAGSTFSTPRLESYRMQREQRRWLGVDLLCGRVNPHHPLFQVLLDHGLEEREILWFAENPCPPSMLGLNYYVTSDRFLDERVHLYPHHFKGGDSGFEPLVDIEAVRVRPEGIRGAGAVIREAWDRYRIPVAITEAHLGCDSDQQVHWLAETWIEAQRALDAGVDVRAVTAWGLLGLYDWCNLCTRETGSYEPGVFDLTSGMPAPTALSRLVQALACGQPPEQASLPPAGWWRRESRLMNPVTTEI